VMQSGLGAVSGWVGFGRRVWPAEAGQLTAMRAEVHRWLAALDLPDDAEHDLVLAVSEAASNAIEHAYSPGAVNPRIELIFWLDDGCVSLAVVDQGDWREPPTGPRGRGFGLDMMRRLVTNVAIDHPGRGTRVLLQHALPGLIGHPNLAPAPVHDGDTER
jgi:serine/threonine-protein kinase RsbW